MRIISRSMIRQFEQRHPESASALDHWYRIMKSAEVHSFAELRDIFSSADMVGKYTVFNIGAINTAAGFISSRMCCWQYSKHIQAGVTRHLMANIRQQKGRLADMLLHAPAAIRSLCALKKHALLRSVD
ncbi:hypothetical protein U14_04382 [Candidatus Moduliflexus flocculans]|uniref:Uncharacterized protein n=1 Tax=Candidatus Moduliflexus flocculans TaxID=1499966 RepID=A0A0S6W3T4_9BACT|nr:hypothetical protein U14_04382 [Candidatus Moduliflexus flocculans]